MSRHRSPQVRAGESDFLAADAPIPHPRAHGPAHDAGGYGPGQAGADAGFQTASRQPIRWPDLPQPRLALSGPLPIAKPGPVGDAGPASPVAVSRADDGPVAAVQTGPISAVDAGAASLAPPTRHGDTSIGPLATDGAVPAVTGWAPAQDEPASGGRHRSRDTRAEWDRAPGLTAWSEPPSRARAEGFRASPGWTSFADFQAISLAPNSTPAEDRPVWSWPATSPTPGVGTDIQTVTRTGGAAVEEAERTGGWPGRSAEPTPLLPE